MKPPPLTVVGAGGRIGTLVKQIARGRDQPVATVLRGEPLPAGVGPILLAVRNDDLKGILARTPHQRHHDLVFVQNGLLGPWLAEHGMAETTIGVLWVAVPKVGAPPEDGGISVFAGPWASDIAELFRAGGVRAQAVDHQTLAVEAAVKFAWICTFGLLGACYELPVGELVPLPEVEALVEEMSPVLARAVGHPLDAGELLVRLQDYSEGIEGYRATLKEWAWRNGWLAELAKRQGVDLPVHAAILAAVGGPPG